MMCNQLLNHIGKDILVLLYAAIAASTVAAIPPTSYHYAAMKDDVADTAIVPMAWSCTPWSAWKTLAYYCVGSATCSNGCSVRAKLQYRSQTCTDEAGNSFFNEEQKEVFNGCCTGGPGGQCPNPLKLPMTLEPPIRGIE